MPEIEIEINAETGEMETTIGGRRASGFGQEMGEEGFLAYTNVKSVLVDVHANSVKEM